MVNDVFLNLRAWHDDQFYIYIWLEALEIKYPISVPYLK